MAVYFSQAQKQFPPMAWLTFKKQSMVNYNEENQDDFILIITETVYNRSQFTHNFKISW